MKSDVPLKLFLDNASAINLAKHPVLHGRSKHIETRFHFLREQVNSNKLQVVHCRSENQVADILTKPLRIDQFEKLRSLLGLMSLKDLD